MLFILVINTELHCTMYQPKYRGSLSEKIWYLKKSNNIDEYNLKLKIILVHIIKCNI